MYSIISLKDSDSFVNLFFHNRLNSSKFKKTFKKNIYYLFFYKNQIHGIYQFRNVKKEYTFFYKNHFKPIVYFCSQHEIPLEDYKKILAIFELENQNSVDCFFQIKEEKEFYNFFICSANFKHLFFSFSIKKSDKLLSLSKNLNEILNNDIHQKNLNELKLIGDEFYKLIFKKEIQNFLETVTSFVISNRSNLPIQFCFDGEKFCFIQNKTIHHKPINNQKINTLLNKFSIFSSLEDKILQKETQEILKVFQDNKIKTDFEKIISQNLSSIHQQDFVYIGCHGKMEKKNFYLVDKDNKINFPSKNTLPPKVLFLNSCYSSNSKVKNWFFSGGGQTLIIGEGKLNCDENDIFLKSFFWQICLKKETVLEAFYSLQKKSLYKNLNGFRMKIYGYGQEKVS